MRQVLFMPVEADDRLLAQNCLAKILIGFLADTRNNYPVGSLPFVGNHQLVADCLDGLLVADRTMVSSQIKQAGYTIPAPSAYSKGEHQPRQHHQQPR